MAVDGELVKRKLALILDDLEKLRSLAGVSREEFVSDYHPRLMVERLLERVIGRMIDINYHLLTETRLTIPKDYYESFLRLADLEILSPDEARKFAQLAGLRNRLAHEYNNLDDRKLFDAFQTTMSVLPLYLKAVERFLTGNS